MDATGAATLTVPLANLTLTKYAQGLAVVAGNATGSAGPDSAATAKIKDYCALVGKSWEKHGKTIEKPWESGENH